ncbi:MAG TPA: hypothetical protein VF158_07915 [Longimicrobiales bacterium]
MKTTRALMFAIVLAGCAVRLGGPKPVEYRTMAFNVGQGAGPAEVAGWIRRADANLVLLAAREDSAWFGEVARQAELTLSGPGAAGSVSYAFLAGEPVGDTTIVLPLAGGEGVGVHDALYQVDDDRYLDLLAVGIPAAAEPREAVKALLQYMATDVMTDAAVVLAVDVPDAATGDSISALLSPAFRDARTCVAEDGRASADAGWGMRLFFGPEAKLRCEEARPLGARGPLMARLVLSHF